MGRTVEESKREAGLRGTRKRGRVGRPPGAGRWGTEGGALFLSTAPGCEASPMQVTGGRWVQDAVLATNNSVWATRTAPAVGVSGGFQILDWVLNSPGPKPRLQELPENSVERGHAASAFVVGSWRRRAWQSSSTRATTAAEMIGIHSVSWPPCIDRVPLVQENFLTELAGFGLSSWALYGLVLERGFPLSESHPGGATRAAFGLPLVAWRGLKQAPTKHGN